MATDDGVRLVPENAPIVKPFPHVCLRCYNGSFAFVFLDEFPNVIRGQILRHFVRLWASEHVPDAPAYFPVDDVLVVSLHLCQGFLEYYGPDGAIRGWLGTNRLALYHGNYVVDNNTLRYA